MKHFWTWKKIVIFLGIIGLGILGLVIADQRNFMHGREDGAQTEIGNGVPDPLVQGEIPKAIQGKAGTKASVSESPAIDGVNCVQQKC